MVNRGIPVGYLDFSAEIPPAASVTTLYTVPQGAFSRIIHIKSVTVCIDTPMGAGEECVITVTDQVHSMTATIPENEDKATTTSGAFDYDPTLHPLLVRYTLGGTGNKAATIKIEYQ